MALTAFAIASVAALVSLVCELEIVGLAMMAFALIMSPRFRARPAAQLLRISLVAWWAPVCCVVSVVAPRFYRRWRARARLDRIQGAYEPTAMVFDVDRDGA